MIENLPEIILELRKQKIIAYPTESVFGLGCDPDNEQTVNILLKLKQRSWKKGLILVSANYNQLSKYIDISQFNHEQLSYMFSFWPGPTTLVIPANNHAPYWLTGTNKSIAVRISAFSTIKKICLKFGKPLISTSANISGKTPAYSAIEVYEKIKYNIKIMNGIVEGRYKPSSIIDVLSGKLLR